MQNRINIKKRLFEGPDALQGLFCILVVAFLAALILTGCTQKESIVIQHIPEIWPRVDGYYISSCAWDVFGQNDTRIRLRFSEEDHVLVHIEEGTQKCNGFDGEMNYIAKLDRTELGYGFYVGNFPYQYDFEMRPEDRPLRLKGYSHKEGNFIIVSFDFVKDEEICRAE